VATAGAAVVVVVVVVVLGRGRCTTNTMSRSSAAVRQRRIVEHARVMRGYRFHVKAEDIAHVPHRAFK
jgi:hypothetical protein